MLPFNIVILSEAKYPLQTLRLINKSYGGEFGAQVKTHNINVRVGWQF